MNLAAVIRTIVLLTGVVALEICSRTGLVSRFALVPPTEMVTGLWKILTTGKFNTDIALTLSGISIAALLAIAAGFALGILLHAFPRARRALDPYIASYYSVPIFVFYPVFIVLFGLTRSSIIAIGFLYAVMAMITNTLTGLDRIPRVLRKSAKVLHVGRLQTIFLVILPSAFPHFLSGIKFAVAYAFVGIIGAEFILSSQGLGYRISFQFNSFDNVGMYALILLVLIVVSAVNTVLFAWERRTLRRRGLLA